MFDEFELSQIISGTAKGIDIKDLMVHTEYDGYSSGESYIKDFWKIILSLRSEEQSKFLKFVTSCERAPLSGFANLYPLFKIIRVNS